MTELHQRSPDGCQADARRQQQRCSRASVIVPYLHRRYATPDQVMVQRNPNAQPVEVPAWVEFAYLTFVDRVEDNSPCHRLSARMTLSKVQALLTGMESGQPGKPAHPADQLDAVDHGQAALGQDGDPDSELAFRILLNDGLNRLTRLANE